MTGPEDATNPGDTHGEEALGDTLRWVLRSIEDPAVAAGDWIAYEVDPGRGTATALLTDPSVPVSRLRRARILWAALRSDGDRHEERAMGSRLAVAAAAAAYLFHGERLSNHDDEALLASFRSVATDEAVPEPVRTMVETAIRRLAGGAR